jgi:hypothetical protein
MHRNFYIPEGTIIPNNNNYAQQHQPNNNHEFNYTQNQNNLNHEPTNAQQHQIMHRNFHIPDRFMQQNFFNPIPIQQHYPHQFNHELTNPLSYLDQHMKNISYQMRPHKPDTRDQQSAAADSQSTLMDEQRTKIEENRKQEIQAENLKETEVQHKKQQAIKVEEVDDDELGELIRHQEEIVQAFRISDKSDQIASSQDMTFDKSTVSSSTQVHSNNREQQSSQMNVEQKSQLSDEQRSKIKENRKKAKAKRATKLNEIKEQKMKEMSRKTIKLAQSKFIKVKMTNWWPEMNGDCDKILKISLQQSKSVNILEDIFSRAVIEDITNENRSIEKQVINNTDCTTQFVEINTDDIDDENEIIHESVAYDFMFDTGNQVSSIENENDNFIKYSYRHKNYLKGVRKETRKDINKQTSLKFVQIKVLMIKIYHYNKKIRGKIRLNVDRWLFLSIIAESISK